MRSFIRYLAVAVGVIAIAPPGWAGPPFLTDAPEPGETGHWKIHGPSVEGEGRGSDFPGTTGV